MDLIGTRCDFTLKQRKITLIFCLIFFLTPTARPTPWNINNYLPIILDISNFQSISTVFFIRAEDDYSECESNFSPDLSIDLQTWTNLHEWTRILARKQIATCAVTISNLQKLEIYYDQIKRPLFVVFLSEIGVHEFANATKSFKMSFPHWLVIFSPTPENTKRCHQHRDNMFNTKFNTEMFVVCGYENFLHDWYSLDGSKLEVTNVTGWSPANGFDRLASRSVYVGRNNLKGLTLRTVEVHVKPKNRGMIELFQNVSLELMEIMNFTVNVVNKVHDYGRYNYTEGKWTGAVGEISSGHADIGFGDYSMVTSHLGTVDYMLPLINSRNCLFIKDSETFGIQWFAYFKVLDFEIWMTTCLLTIISSIILLILTMGRKSKNTWPHVLFEKFTNVWGLLCQQGLSESPETFYLKLAYFSISAGSLVMYAAYAASLISFLTVSKPYLPFSSLEGFVEDGSYKLIVIKNTAEHQFFETSKDPLIRKMASLMVHAEHLPTNLEAALQQVCDEKVAFYNSDQRKKSVEQYIPCKINEINMGQLSSIAMIISKQNPYSDLFTYYLKRITENGIFHRLRMKIGRNENIRPPSYTPVSIKSSIPLLIILAGGIILALVLLIIERYYSRQCETRIIILRLYTE